MEAGTAVVAMLGVEVEEEDVGSGAVDVEDTMDLNSIGHKMKATIMKPLLKVAVVSFPFFSLHKVLACLMVFLMDCGMHVHNDQILWFYIFP